MPYLNIDDGIDEHPKVDALSDAAYRLWKASLSYCSRNMTDGVVTLSKARRLTVTGKDAVAAELVRSGLWHDLGQPCPDPSCIEARTCRGEGVQGAYLVHDYLQWNHSKEWWEKRRKDQRERKEKWKKRRVEDGGEWHE
jgi:hypothetical protein